MRQTSISDFVRAPAKHGDRIFRLDEPLCLTKSQTREPRYVVVSWESWKNLDLEQRMKLGQPEREALRDMEDQRREAEGGTWLCGCGYMNTGTVCTKCGEAQGAGARDEHRSP